MPPRGKKKTKSERRAAEDEAHGTFACRCLTEDQRAQDGAARKPAKNDRLEADRQANCKASRQANCEASRQAKRQQPQVATAARRRAAQTAPIVPAFGGAMAGDEQDEMIILSTDELIEETDIDLDGDEGGGDDDLEGM